MNDLNSAGAAWDSYLILPNGRAGPVEGQDTIRKKAKKHSRLV